MRGWPGLSTAGALLSKGHAQGVDAPKALTLYGARMRPPPTCAARAVSPSLRVLAAGASALALLVSASAQAGPPESLAAIVLQPGVPGAFVLRYENVLGGLLFSDDEGKTVRLLPGTSITRDGVRGDMPPFAVLSDGTVLVGGSEGLLRIDAHGCSASPIAGNATTTAIALHPTDPSVAFYVTSYGADGVPTGLWRRAASGAVTPLGAADNAAADPVFSATGLFVVSMPGAEEGLRFSETGDRRARTPAAPVPRDAGSAPADAGLSASASASMALRYSDDLGKTWTERTLPSSFGPGTLRLLAVDPRDPARMLLGLDREGPSNPADAVLLTTNAGASFEIYIDGIARLGQVAQASDGRFWLGDMGNPAEVAPSGGLWFGTRIGEPPERLLSGRAITCLARDERLDKLLLCQEYELDQLELTTRSTCRIFGMSDVLSLVSCPGQQLAQSQNVRDQLCGGYCGALHFADAPLCQVFDEPGVLCGPAARAYDQGIGWESAFTSTEHCPGYSGLAGTLDAGVDVLDAAAQGGLTTGDGGPDGGSAVAASPKHETGCSTGASSDPWSAATPLLGLLSLLCVASRRRRAQPE
ncbi:MAG: hypothetical protein JWN48_1568 [Myxococcaceae bacterium]|nr:hypothetical protein [Myxococcaceae bacterium]